jgi:hypothetical protein
VLGRVVEDLLRGVEPQAVEVELVDPVARVGEEELAHRPAVGPSKLIASPHSFVVRSVK